MEYGKRLLFNPHDNVGLYYHEFEFMI